MRLSTYTILVQTNYYLDATSIWPMGKLWITILAQAATLFCWGLKPIPLCALNGECHSFMGCHLHLSQIQLTFNKKKIIIIYTSLLLSGGVTGVSDALYFFQCTKEDAWADPSYKDVALITALPSATQEVLSGKCVWIKLNLIPEVLT